MVSVRGLRLNKSVTRTKFYCVCNTFYFEGDLFIRDTLLLFNCNCDGAGASVA
jgi:hypothetical protein